MNRDLDYVLNYMVKYTKDRFMQDSEPMLNHRDIELVLKHIWELEEKIDKAIEYIKSKHAIIDTDYIRIFDLFANRVEQGYVNELLEILGDKENEN